VNLWTQIEGWASYRKSVTDLVEVERALERLRWLEEFVFHCGPEISIEYFQALQQQIEFAEKKLAELGGGGGRTELVLRPKTDAREWERWQREEMPEEKMVKRETCTFFAARRRALANSPLPGDDQVMAWGKDHLPSWVPTAEELGICESEFAAGQTPECYAQPEQPALVNR
jgi:hypothetical protein